MRNRAIAALFVSALIVAGCGELASSAPAPPEMTPAPAEFQDAPTEVKIAGASYRMDAQVWRNAQPHAGGDGVPRCANLCAKVTLIRVDDRADDGTGGRSAPDVGVTIDSLWVLRGDRLAPFGGVQVTGSGAELEATAERGPRMDHGSILFVVARITTETGGTSSLVRSPAMEVGPDT